MPTPPASPEQPYYWTMNTAEDEHTTPRWALLVDDGRHTDVIAEDMTEPAAAWLLAQLAHRPPYLNM